MGSRNISSRKQNDRQAKFLHSKECSRLLRVIRKGSSKPTVSGTGEFMHMPLILPILLASPPLWLVSAYTLISSTYYSFLLLLTTT